MYDLITSQGDLLANPIFEKLCQNFYEEEKWQRALMVNIGGDNEWTTSVTVTMATFAATGVCQTAQCPTRSNPARSTTTPSKSGDQGILPRSYLKQTSL